MSSGLEGRLSALAEAVELADGRLPAERVASARALVDRAGRRLGLGLEATVVALAGPTGAGKSSLFNALAGAELSTAGARRPTTSTASAAVWGTAGDPLLDWLEVPRRHRMDDGARAEGLVLLDLPDFDSVEATHRAEFERLLELVDLVVWVVDPQKYADATLHDRYLRPLSGHGETTVVVLNQADRLSPEALAACRADIGRLLREDGLDRVPVLATSATDGDGVADVRRLVDDRVAARTAAIERLAADVTAIAGELGSACGEGERGAKVGRAERDRLDAALANAAGAPVVVGAVARAHRRSGVLATGWPFARWVRRARPDPLRRLHLSGEPKEGERTSLPGATPVQRAQVAAATRELAASAAGDLAPPWPGLVRGAATASEDAIADRLDRAVAGTDLRTRTPWWWRIAGVLQLGLALAVAAGALWLLALVGLGFLRLEDVLPLPDVLGIPLPTLLLGGGALLGILLAAVTRAINAIGARRRARRAEKALRRRVDEVARELVVAPVEAELEAREALCSALRTAAAAGRGRRRASG